MAEQTAPTQQASGALSTTGLITNPLKTTASCWECGPATSVSPPPPILFGFLTDTAGAEDYQFLNGEDFTFLGGA